MKKLAILLLVLSMLPLASLAEGEPWRGDASNMPVSEEKINLDVWIPVTNAIEDMGTNEMTLWYEELSNVHVNWTVVSVDDSAQLKNLSLASGEYPDIYFSTMTTNEIITYGAEGIFIPLEELMEAYAPNMREVFEISPEIKELITAPDGHIYSFYRCGTASAEEPHCKMWAFLPWMNQYTAATGKDEPQTLDALCEMLAYFRDHDMNGNGDADDEIPMLGNMQLPDQGSDPFYYLMNCFTYFPSRIVYGDGEKAYYPAMGEAYREGLRYIRGMVEEGLISEITWTQNLNQFRAIVNVTSPEDMVVGCPAAPYTMRFVTQSIYTRAYEDFFVLPPMTGPSGLRVVPDSQRSGMPNWVVTSACEDPVAAVKWLDYLTSRDVVVWTHFGDEGTDWAATGTYDAVNGPEIQRLTQSLMHGNATTQNRRWGWWLSRIFLPGTYQCFTLLAEEGTAAYVENKAADIYNEYVRYDGRPGVIWCEDEDLALEMEELNKLIMDYTKNQYSQFLLGVQDVNDDDVWAAYEQGLEDLNLDHYLEVQAEYWYGAK